MAHIPAARLLPPALVEREPDAPAQRTDPAEARRRFDAAGSLPPVRIGWPTRDLVTGEVVAQALREAGLEVDLRVFESSSELLEQVEAGQVELFRMGWLADYPDAESFAQVFAAGSPNNPGGYVDPAYEAVLAELDVASDPAERLRLGTRLDDLLVRDTAAVFLRHEVQVHSVSDRVEDWAPYCTSPLNRPDFARVGLGEGP